MVTVRDFLACDQDLTLVHHVMERDGDRYECYPISGASWYEKMVVATSGDGAKPVNVVKVRIPSERVPACMPAKLDFIVKGTVEAVTRPAELKGKTYFQITAVADNRRGALAHVMVSGT